jgi:adenylate cyclase
MRRDPQHAGAKHTIGRSRVAARAEADAAARPSSRRLAAILHADLVGFSRLMSDDEAEAHRTLRVELDVMTASVGAHQGRVVNYAGDALLAEFATASGALACAVELQAEIDRLCAELREIRGLPVRIGLSVGEVIVDGEEIYGHGVNVAVRLQALAAPGETLASESFRVAAGATPGVSFDDRGEHELKNIAEPMRVYRVVAGQAPAAARSARPVTPRRSSRGPTIAAGIALLLAVAAGWLDRQQLLFWGVPSAPVAEAESAIAVLPFLNLSDDAKQDYFVDGMTDDLITDLSKLSGLLVISRHTALSLKESAIPAPDLARQLGVRYVLEGSVRRAGNRIRVNAQLIDAQSDRHIWAERYDRELTDVFAVQDEVKREIVEALALQLTTGEQVALAERPTASLEAYEYY